MTVGALVQCMSCPRRRLGTARPLVQQPARLLGEVTRLLGEVGCQLPGAAGVAVDEEVGGKVTGGKVAGTVGPGGGFR